MRIALIAAVFASATAFASIAEAAPATSMPLTGIESQGLVQKAMHRHWHYGPRHRCRVVTTYRRDRFGRPIRVTRRICR